MTTDFIKSLTNRIKTTPTSELLKIRLSKYKLPDTDEYDLVKLYESGEFSRNFLSTAFGEETITGLEESLKQYQEQQDKITADLQALEPFKVGENQYNIREAFTSGVPMELLTRNFGNEIQDLISAPPATEDINLADAINFQFNQPEQTAFDTTVLPILPDELKTIYNQNQRAKYLESQFDAGNYDPALVSEFNQLNPVSDEDFNLLVQDWQENEQQRITDLVTAVFPEFLNAPEGKESQVVNNYLTQLYTDESIQEAFRNRLQTIGRNTDTEALLKDIMPGISERDIRQVFGENVTPLNMLPLGTYTLTEQPLQDIVDFGNTDFEGFRRAVRYEGRSPETEALLNEAYGRELTEQELDKFFESGVADDFIQGNWLPQPLEDYWDLAIQGVGDILSISGGIADRFGADSLANELKLAGSYGEVFSKDVKIAEQYTPEWFAQNMARMAPMMLGLMGTSIISGGAAGAAIAAAGGGSLLQLVGSAVAAGVLSSAGEGLLEAGDAYNEAKRRGFTDEEANQVFDKVFQQNVVALSASNIAQYGLTFFVPGGRTASFMVKALTFGFDTVSEGLEEVGQLAIQRGALGDAQKFDSEMLQNFVLGAGAGLGFAGIGVVHNTIISKIEGKMNPTQYDQLRSKITEYMGQGLSRKAAESKAWDEFASTPEGEAMAKEAVQEVQSEEKIKMEAEKPQVVKAIKEMSDHVQPPDAKVDALVNEITQPETTALTEKLTPKQKELVTKAEQTATEDIQGIIDISKGDNQIAIDSLEAEIDKMSSELKARSTPYHAGMKNKFPKMTTQELDVRANKFQDAVNRLKAGQQVAQTAPTIEKEAPKTTVEKKPAEIVKPRKTQDITKSLSQAIREAKPARETTEALKSKELARRASIYASILKGGEGSKAFEKAKGALKGTLPQADFELDLESFGITDADIESMFDEIRTTEKISERKVFQRLNTAEALTKLLTGQIPTTGEINLLENIFGTDLVEAIVSKYPTSKKVSRVISEILNIPRTLQTIADLSATFRQGIVLAVGQPVQFTKAFINELKAVFSEKNFGNLTDILDNMVYSDKAAEHKLYQAHNARVASELTAYEEGFQGRLLEKVPALKNIIRASERAYTMFLDTLRMETWNYYCRKWEGTGKSVKDYDNLASFINHATGRGDLGKLSNAGAWLNGVFFSPRFVVSRIQVPLDLITSTPAVRKVVARNLVSFVVTGLGVLMLAKLGGAETEDDPRSADFGKIKIGNTRIDFWGSYLPYVRFVTQVLLGERKSTSTGEVYEVDWTDIVQNFVRSKLAPMPGLVWDLKAGKTFIGEEINVENAAQLVYERLTPIFFQDIRDAIQDTGLPGIGYGILSMLGVGIQTYENNWNSLEDNLGLPKRAEDLPFTIVNEIYSSKDYYGDVSPMISNATADMLKEKWGIPEKVISVAEAKDIKRELEILPNQKLYMINADPQDGDTFEQYYIQWKQRGQITDKEELKEFDTQYPNAHLGNISQSEYVLLQQYNQLDKSGKEQFLKDHPELTINPRTEWLKSHPAENALLAIWGQANILTKEAYTTFQNLIKTLDIPSNALPERTLPPDTSIDNYFSYLDILNERSASSWEAQILMIDDPDLRNFLERDLPDTPREALVLKIKHRDLYDLSDSYSNKDSINYIESDKARQEALDKLKADNPDWVDDTRRIEAIEKDGLDYQELWVERGRIIDGDKIGSSDKSNSSEAKVWLLDHPDVFQWALDNEILTDDGSTWNEPVLRLNAKWRVQDDEYDAIQSDDLQEQVRLREEYLANNEEYRLDRHRRKAYQAVGPEGQTFTDDEAELYVEYMELSEKGKRRDRFLIDNPEFAKSMHVINSIDLPDKVPSIQYDDIYDQYQDDFERMEGLGDNKSEFYIEDTKERDKARNDLRFKEDGTLTDFGIAEIRRNAYGDYIPDEYVERYVDYYKIAKEGIPQDWPKDRNNNTLTWYNDDWYLFEHPKFYEDIYLGILENEPIDFEKLPTREVFNKYVEYVNLIEGKPREDYRFNNRDLEEWLLLTKKVTTPIWEQKRRVRLTPGERRQEEINELINRIRI
jgi:hypothetical protein